MNSYDYYISLDYSQAKMAIAIGTKEIGSEKVIELDTDIDVLKRIIKSMSSSKILTFEESTASQWLWTELRNYVDEIIVCDPFNNFLLFSGPKSDRIDALKLLELLRGGQLRSVYHSKSKYMQMRTELSTYNDMVKTGVAWKNRLKSQRRARGGEDAVSESDRFTEAVAEYMIKVYEEFKSEFERRFCKTVRSSKQLNALTRIPGIGIIGAYRIGAIVVTPYRFRSKGHFWAYCGLVKYRKSSGGKNYGRRNPRCCRQLKAVFKTAALACTQKRSRSSMKVYYDNLISKGKPVHVAKNQVARKIASIALAVMMSGEYYNPKKVLKKVVKEDGFEVADE
jgi:transposase